MKILYSLIIFLSSPIFSNCQPSFYIYLQTDNGSAFYAKLADKVISSNAAGYLIVSDLPDSTFNILIGTNAASLVTARYSIKLNGKDKGYIIKTKDNNIELSDIQTSAVIKPLFDTYKKSMVYEKRTDDFTKLLSRSASDPSLLFVPVEVKQESTSNKQEDRVSAIEQKPVLKKEEASAESIKNSTVKAFITNDDSNLKTAVKILPAKKGEDSAVNNPITLKEIKKDTLATAVIPESRSPENNKEYTKSIVKKHSESSTTEGFGLVYFDTYGEKTDTIQLMIPNPRFQLEQTDIPKKQIELQASEPKITDENKKNELKYDTTRIIEKGNVIDSSQKETVINKSGSLIKPLAPVCKTIANSNDFFRIRKNMAARSSDEAMVDEAKRFFKKECFTTEQIRSLSSLFLTSAGKYELFDAAYMHVSDKEQFNSLQTEIRDDYYLKRFKALIGE